MLIKTYKRVWIIIQATVLLSLLSACTAPKTNCAIEDLLLDKDWLPDQTYAEPIVSPIPEMPKRSIAQGFYYAPDDVSYMVIQWNSISASKREYKSMVKAAFDVDQYMGPWETPSELSDFSEIADEYLAACGVDLGSSQCRLAVRYNKYTVYLRMSHSDDGLNMPIFIDILKHIDNKFAQCFE